MDKKQAIENRRQGIARRIRERRNELGLSVEEVAEKLGKNRATVYRYESSDIQKLPVDVLIPLSEILQTTPSYLMGWTDDPYDYDRDLDSRFSVIPTAIYKSLREQHGDDLKAVWDAWLRYEEDCRQDSFQIQDNLVSSTTHKKLELLARHLDRIPEATRNRLIQNFENSIDTYFEAMQIPKEDE